MDIEYKKLVVLSEGQSTKSNDKADRYAWVPRAVLEYVRSRCWHDTAYGATVVAEQEQSPGGCEACRNAGTMSSAVSGAASVAPWWRTRWDQWEFIGICSSKGKLVFAHTMIMPGAVGRTLPWLHCRADWAKLEGASTWHHRFSQRNALRISRISKYLNLCMRGVYAP